MLKKRTSGPFAAKRSPYRGVYWNKANSKWRARVKLGPIYHYGGEFTDEIEAARAYDSLSMRLGKSFDELNFPPSPVP